MNSFIFAPLGGSAIYPATDDTLGYSLPSGLSDRAALFVYPVSPSTPPEFDPTTEKLVEITPTSSGTTWSQAWSVVPLTEEERATLFPPQWVQFAGALILDESVNAFIGGLAATQPVLQLMLGVGLGQASQGDPATFLAAWAAALPLLPEGLAEHVADLAVAFDLSTEFVAALNPV